MKPILDYVKNPPALEKNHSSHKSQLKCSVSTPTSFLSAFRWTCLNPWTCVCL